MENTISVDEETIEILYGQVPVDCTREQIRDALCVSNNDKMAALELLWNIPPPPPKPFKFLDDIREIADACDRQMEERDMKNKYFKTINA
jgi:hypothetical protein